MHINRTPEWRKVTPPTGWDMPIPFDIEKRGRKFRPDPSFNLFNYSGISSLSGTDYYVDPVNGSDDGGVYTGLSWSTAFKSIANATPDARNARVIYIRPGTYGPTLSGGYYVDGGWVGSFGNKAKAIICVGGQAILTPRILQSYSAVDLHYTSTSVQISSVMDASVLNANGSYTKYVLKTSIAEVDATPGSFYWSANVLYIRTIDSRTPDSSIYALKNLTNGMLVGVNLNAVDDVRYLENCTFLFCTDRLLRYFNSSTSGNRLKGYFKNCTFSHSLASPNNYDLLDIDGGVDVIADNCICEYGNLDGFNYHMTPYTGIPTAIEINCIGRYCGTSGATNNGSSTHEAAPIVRINGTYHNSFGANIGDVGGAKVWNLGVESHHSLTTTPTRNCGFLVGNGGPTIMWNDCCYSHDNTYDLAAIEGETIYKRNHLATATEYLEGGGTISTY